MHVDSSNAGLSLIITLGPFASRPTWAVARNQQVLLPRHEWAELDGNQPHMSLPYSGDRVSIVLFVHATALTPSALPLLRQAAAMGLSIPNRFDRVATPVVQNARMELESAEQQYTNTCLEVLEGTGAGNMTEVSESSKVGKFGKTADQLLRVIMDGAAAILYPNPKNDYLVLADQLHCVDSAQGSLFLWNPNAKPRIPDNAPGPDGGAVWCLAPSVLL